MVAAESWGHLSLRYIYAQPTFLEHKISKTWVDGKLKDKYILSMGAIFAQIQSQMDAADNSFCLKTSLTGVM